MDLVIDHVATTWADLDDAAETFEDLGFPVEYGGTHGDGTTEMSMVAFPDSSYLELVSNVEGEDPERWPRGIEDAAGPFAWAVEVGDVVAHLQSALSKGYFVAGPQSGERERPDGTRVEWDAGVLGDENVRSLLPFVIADRTPRRYRVSPDEAMATGPLSGVSAVVLAVEAIDPAAELFQSLYRYPSPERSSDERRGIEVAVFPGEPVVLVTPTDEAGRSTADGEFEGDGNRGPTGKWVRDRLDRYGERPCGCLLRATDLLDVRESYPLSAAESWPSGRVAWVDDDRVGRWLGVVDLDRD